MVLAGVRLASAAPQSISLSVGDYDVAAGETLSIPIVVTGLVDVTQLATAKLTLEVGPYLLEPLDARTGDALTGVPAGALTFDFSTPGRADISFDVAVPVALGVGELFVVDFLVHPDAHQGETSGVDMVGTNDNEVILHDTPGALPPGIKPVLDHGSVTVLTGQVCDQGDVTGDALIGTGDAIVILRVVTGLLPDPSPEMLCSADANLDRDVNTGDAVWVLRDVVGLPNKQIEALDAGSLHARLVPTASGADLVIDGARGLHGLDVDVAYDPAQASLGDLGRAPRGLRLEHEIVPGQRRIRWAGGEPLAEGDQLTLPLTLAMRGESAVTVTRLAAYGGDGRAIEMAIDDLEIRFSSATPSRVTVSSYPNPFNPSTRIRFDLPRAGQVRLDVYDAAGKRVRTLVEGNHPAGPGEVVWNGTDQRGRPVASGVYFARIGGEGVSASHRLVLVK